MEKLTKKEQELFKTLIRLGDPKGVALKTVLSDRSKPDNTEAYRMAYTN